MTVLRERCQLENTVYRYLFPLATARAVRRAVRRAPARFAPRAGTGAPSRFRAGDAVRVKDADAIRGTLDAAGRLRGLQFTDEQWAYCGERFVVDAVVTRMMDDHGRMRAIGRTVALDGATCDGVRGTAGCGRACPLLFRDEWLEPSPDAIASRAADAGAPRAPKRFARVKSVDAILATLDGSRRRDGVLFMPAMEHYAGARLPVRKRVVPVAATWWRRPGGEFYVLEGARCNGESLGADGPCHRRCGLLWHRDWLELE